MNKIVSSVLLILLSVSCWQKEQHATAKNITDTVRTNKQVIMNHEGQVKSNDLAYFSDSIFHGYKEVLSYYFKKYSSDTCFIWHDKTNFIDSVGVNGYHEVKTLGIVHNNIKSSVFVLYPLSYCTYYNTLDDERGFNKMSYYFTDTTLPRLQTDSYCCHPSNIFLAGDIDEDGVSEIGQYYSSCGSHYKSLFVYTLKNNQWKEIGHSVFDQHYMTYDRQFSSYVKKAGKGKFIMYEKTDLSSDSTNAINGHWLKFSF